MRTILCVGPLPPPLHGQAAVTRAMAAAFAERGFRVVVKDTAPRRAGLLRAVDSGARRLKAALAPLALAGAGGAGLYLGLSAGYGRLGDIASIAVARLCGLPITLHHHSFAYLDRPDVIGRVLCRLAGPRARHVVLGPHMAKSLRRAYGALRAYPVSNAAVMPADPSPRTSVRLEAIGFLGNITLDKGIDRFVALAEALRARSLEVAAHAAGPCTDPDARALVEDAVARGVLVWHGPVSGAEKAGFLAGIDCLVMPSRYRTEAEPLVVIEAMRAGRPVIATRRGEMASLVAAAHGLLLDREAADLEPAVALIARWRGGPPAFAQAADAARRHAAALLADSSARLAIVMAHAAPRAAKARSTASSTVAA